jgi:hypothetical protein
MTPVLHAAHMPTSDTALPCRSCSQSPRLHCGAHEVHEYQAPKHKLSPLRSHSAVGLLRKPQCPWMKGCSRRPTLPKIASVLTSRGARLIPDPLLPCSSVGVDRTTRAASRPGRPTFAMPGVFGPQEPRLRVRANGLILTAPTGLWIRMWSVSSKRLISVQF